MKVLSFIWVISVSTGTHDKSAKTNTGVLNGVTFMLEFFSDVTAEV